MTFHGFQGPPSRGDQAARGPHLGHRVAALADGELDHDLRDSALAHVAECRDCLRLLDAERRLKAQLAALETPPVPLDLTLRLLTLPDLLAPELSRPRGRRARRFREPTRFPELTRDRPPRRPDALGADERRWRRRRTGATAGAVLSVAGVGLLTAFIVGLPVRSGTPVTPPAATFTTGHTSPPTAAPSPGDPPAGPSVSFVRSHFGGVLRPVRLDVAGVTSPVLVPTGVPAPLPSTPSTSSDVRETMNR